MIVNKRKKNYMKINKYVRVYYTRKYSMAILIMYKTIIDYKVKCIGNYLLNCITKQNVYKLLGNCYKTLMFYRHVCHTMYV